jgi:hypothetical protein
LFGKPSIDGSTVAFHATQSNGDDAVFAGSGGALTTIANERDTSPVGILSSPTAPSISNGQVAFFALYDDPTSTESTHGLFVGSGGPLTNIVKTGDQSPSGTFQSLGFPSISHETVAFQGVDTAGPGIFTATLAGSSILIARAAIPTSWGVFDYFSDPKIGGNTVAFLASFDESLRRGVFTSRGGTLINVIKTGDTLFGSTVTELAGNSFEFPRFGIDVGGSGNVAFTYRLVDGRSGIAIATPVPESGGSVLALIALAVCGVARNHCQTRELIRPALLIR